MTSAFYAPTVVAQINPLADVQKLVKQGQLPLALEKTDAYVASRPKDPQGRFLRGVILAEMNRNADAIAVFAKLTEEFPELPEPYNNLAVLYAQQRQYEKARNALEMAIRTHPSYATAHENLGDVYSKLASQAYDKALQLDNSNAGAQTKLALIRELISVSARQSGRPATAPRLPATPPVARPATPTAPTLVAAAPLPPVLTAPLASPAPKAPAPASAPLQSPKPQAAATIAAAPASLPAAAPAAAPTVAKADRAPEPAAKPAAKANNPDEVAKALQDWAAAWSRKDVKGYLARYANNFDPPGGMNRKAWANERESRINKPGKIEVEVRNIQVNFDSADRATVRFRQHYRSANLKTQATKTIVFVRSGGKWLILQERVG